MKTIGNSAFEDALSFGSERLDELRAEIERATGQVRDQGEASMAEVERAVQERPFMSLLAAFGTGMLISRLMDRG